MPPRKRRGKIEKQPTLTSGQKAPALLGWCQANQHGDECWYETESLICKCKCHSKGKR